MNITLAVKLSPRKQERVQAERGNRPSVVRESYGINLFRGGILTHHELGHFVGLDRFETDVLGRRKAVDR